MKKRWICLTLLALLLVGGIALADTGRGQSTGVVVGGPVTVYDGTWAGSKAVGTLQTGAPVLILQYENQMVQVFSLIDRLAGWVPSANVRVNQLPPVYPGIVISQNASLRESPTTTAKLIANLSNGTVFDILSEENDWYHGRYWNEKTGAQVEGYVRTYFVVRDPMFVTTTKLTFVYAMPSRGSKMVGQLVAGTQLVVIGEYNNYWVVNLRSASGFILKSDIEYDQITGNG